MPLHSERHIRYTRRCRNREAAPTNNALGFRRISALPLHLVPALSQGIGGAAWDPTLDRIMSGHFWDANDLALCFAGQGRTEAAIEILDRGQAAGTTAYDVLLLNPTLRPLWKEARFRAIAATAQTSFEAMLVEIEAARARDEFPSFLEQPLVDLGTDLAMATNELQD